jgi:hypothetical protein
MEGSQLVMTIRLILEIAAFIATIIGMTALFFGYRTHRISYKQLNFQIVDRCTTRFHEVMKQLHKDPENPDSVSAYLGLCNEEIFYFKHKYLPEDIIIEWIEGMTNSVPHWVGNKNVNIHRHCIRYTFGKPPFEQNLMLNYQRLRVAFSFDSIEEYKNLRGNKKEFINKVIHNLRKKSLMSEWEWNEQDFFEKIEGEQSVTIEENENQYSLATENQVV